MDQIIEVIKSQIIDELEKEKLSYKEYQILLLKTKDLILKIKSKFGGGGDVFFKAGVFLAKSQQNGMAEFHTNQMETDKYSPRHQQLGNEEQVKIRIVNRAGGAGDFSRYGEIPRRKT